MAPTQPHSPGVSDRLRSRRGRWLLRHAPDGNIADLGFHWAVVGVALLVVALLAMMAVQMVRASSVGLHRLGWGFLGTTVWDPVHDRFGALAFLYGTVVSSLLALGLALPISLGVALYLAELAPRWLKGPMGFVVELLAAVPSVVYGLWGIFALAPWLRSTVEPMLGRVLGFLPQFQGPRHGVGMLAAGVVLAIMILPTISSVSREVLRAVPSSLREGALALGATQSEALRIAVIPAARSGIFGAVILGLGRALGETMAVTMVIGNRTEISSSLFAPSYTMASAIANEFAEATGELHLSVLAELGLLLFGVTIVLNILARLLVMRAGRVAGGGGA